MNVPCWYCKQSFQPGPRDRELVVAWINSRRRKGANSPIVKHTFHIYAHAECVRFPNQGLMLELPTPEEIL